MLKYNISTHFIMPVVGFVHIPLSVLDDRGMLVNTYLKNDQLKDDVADCFMVIAYKNGYTTSDMKIDSLIKKTEGFVFSYNMDYNKVVYAFNFKTIYLKDIELIKKGQYSSVSEEYKNNFVLSTNVDGVMEDTFCKQVFDNNHILKDYYEKKLDMILPDNIQYFTKMEIENETLK